MANYQRGNETFEVYPKQDEGRQDATNSKRGSFSAGEAKQDHQHPLPPIICVVMKRNRHVLETTEKECRQVKGELNCTDTVP